MLFLNERHEESYSEICGKMKYLDCYHYALAYLLSLDSDCRKHISDLYDFQEDGIKLDGVFCPWQTGSSKRTTRLAFNLWNDCCADGIEEDAQSCVRYTPSEIFCCCYAPYFWQAIKLRFPEYALIGDRAVCINGEIVENAQKER